MKKSVLILFLFVVLVSTSLVSPATYANCGAVSAGVLNGKTCREVTACGSLNIADSYYLLMNNISAGGSCILISSVDNIVLDLNEYAIEYATSVSGEPPPAESSIRGILAYDTSNYLEIKNGFLKDASNSTEYSFASTIQDKNNVSFHDIVVITSGIGSQGITFERGITNFSVYNNKIIMYTPKANLCSHFGLHPTGINLLRQFGEGGRIYNNTITGIGMKGIQISSCGQWPDENPLRIYDNYISQWSPVRDGYAIAVEDNSPYPNKCGYPIEIFSNTINQTNGRGIIIAGQFGESDNGPQRVEVYDNYVEVREGWDCEYDTAGFGVGIRLRFGAGQNYVHDNYVRSFGGIGVANGTGYLLGPRDGAAAIGIYPGSSPPYGGGNVFENNHIEVSTNSINYGNYIGAIAGRISDGAYPGTVSLPTHYKNNTFVSNNFVLGFSHRIGIDGSSFNDFFESNKLVQSSNPLDFETINAGRAGFGSGNITFFNTTTTGLADVDDISFYDSGGDYFFNFGSAWALNVQVNNGATPIQGAQVDIYYSNNQPATGIINYLSSYRYPTTGLTDVNGEFNTGLQEYSYDGYYPSPTKTDFIPYIVNVTYLGEIQSQVVNLDSPQTLNFFFGGSSPDINTDGKINVIDLAIVIFWQGKTDTDPDWDDYLHLDLNEDGAINWDDVQIVLSYL